MTTRFRQGLLATLLAVPALAGAARADVDLHGFVEGAWGARVVEDPVFDDTKDWTLEETRAQIQLNALGDVGEAFVRADILQDHVVSDGTDVLLREGFLRFRTAGEHLDVKAGRQALTWGTGDLVFINDLFPKDWESFFAGREDQYLKAPSDALRLGIFGLPFDVDLVLTPEFTPDRLPAPGERLSFFLPPGVVGPTELPENLAENGEVAVRLSRYVGNFTVAFYGYRGYFKTPAGMRMVRGGLVPYHPKLTVGGASLRGAALGGVTWLEGGYYDSREDRDGTNPLVENSTLRYLAGFERQVATDFNVTAQYYGEWMMDYSDYEASVGSAAAEDELRHLVTLRLEKMLHYQLVRLSAFTFWSPTDEDEHVRLLASYKVSDEIEVAVGGNVFAGEKATTMFGQFRDNDSVFTRLRYTF